VVAGNDEQDRDKNQVDERADHQNREVSEGNHAGRSCGDSTSPSHNLQGTSCTVGGFSCGHALGNTYMSLSLMLLNLT